MEAHYLQERLPAELMSRDRYRCAQLQQEIRRRQSRQQATDRLEASLVALVDTSLARVERRRQSVPALDYPAELPVTAQRRRILDALDKHQVIIVAGATGSGKTTQLPKLCLELGRGVRGRIGHTQPRRIAARTVAARIADELHTPVGELLGYQVRFADHCSERTLVKLMTDGILLAEVQKDRFLDQYDTLIIDEAHERSLNVDFLLGYLKTLLPRRPDLKLVVTSATIDVESFSRYFDGAPVIDVSGRTWPVEVEYLAAPEETRDIDLAARVLEACHHIVQMESVGRGQGQGDILVFLPGERDIRQCALALRRANFPHWDILPLYARLGRAEQNRVFDSSSRRGRRVVLATNVAETSLTVPGIRYVIDTGVARISRYSHRSRVQRLPIEPISQASAQQRSGRCGRQAPGTCIRLYSEEDFNARPEFTDSEIHRTNLASVILRLTAMRFGDIDQFPFIEAPDPRMVRDGYSLLQELGATDKGGQLTAVGKALARIPADPRVARMLLESKRFGCVAEVLIVAAGLSIQDPRERPLDKQQAADQAHSRFHSDNSDFVALIKLWNHFEGKRQELSKSALRKLCKKEFLSLSRMFEWRDLHYQLTLVCRELGIVAGTEPATDDSIHQALLCGLLSHIGQRQERREYRGTRNRQFRLFPGSRLAVKPPPWLMATELVDTGVVYARINAAIQPQWIVAAAEHLLSHSYSEPHFSRRRQAVMVAQKTSLFGLVISENTQVSYGPIDGVVAREIFIRSGLVEGNYTSDAGFWRHNQGLIGQIGELETRLRGRGLLMDDEALQRFYDEKIPQGIYSRASLDQWRKRAERETPRLLYLEREQLLRSEPDQGIEQQFPDTLDAADLRLPLKYTFAPGKAADGVTVLLPLAALNRLDPARFEWLVPGLLRDKCIELVKSLPRQLRKRFVPVPDTVDRVLAGLPMYKGSLCAALGHSLQALSGVVIDESDWRPDKLDPFYHMHFAVIDAGGKTIDSGRDLAVLVQRLRPSLQAEIVRIDPQLDSVCYRSWEFGALPESRKLVHGDVELLVYPALVDRGDGVVLENCDRPEDARRQTRLALARLYMFAMPQQARYVRKEFLRGNRLELQLGKLAQRDELLDDYLLAVFSHQFVEGRDFPTAAAEFEAIGLACKGGLVSTANEYHDRLQQIISLHSDIHDRLGALQRKVWQYAIDDIGQQLAGLLGPHFLKRTDFDSIRQYSRYLRGIVSRIDKLAGHQQKDSMATAQIAPHVARLQHIAGDSFEELAQSPLLLEYRWLLEEFRLSLFAQDIGARKAVSGKRLDKAWQRWQALAVSQEKNSNR